MSEENKLKSRKLWFAVGALVSALAVMYSPVDPAAMEEYFSFLTKLTTFYLLGQAGIDTVKTFKTPPPEV